MRKVSTITGTVVTALALSAPAWAAAAGAGASTAAPAGPRPVVRVHGMHLVHVQLPRTHLPHLTPHPVVSSGNWAGYASVAKKGVQLRFVSADFTIPSVNCATSTLGTAGLAYASNWVGLDGFSSRTVEQTGVDSFCDSSKVAHYDAWYEMYPLDPVVFSGVGAGDAITASVFFTSHGYGISLKDLTTGAHVQTTQPCPKGSTCRNSSAEVITEDPGQSSPVIDLADFGMVNFTGVAVTSRSGTHGGLTGNSLWTSSKIIMKGANGRVLAQPSGLFGGKAYNVAWKAAQ